MILDIKLVKKTSMFCDESAAASVAKWLGRDYEMMYKRILGFSFDAASSDQLPIGERVHSGYDILALREDFKRYHGIDIVALAVEGNIYRIVEREVNNGMPVLVFPMTKYCSWITDTNEQQNYFFIIGFDENNVYGYDIHNGIKEVQAMRIWDLESSYEECDIKEVRVYRIVNDGNNIPSFDELKEEVFEKLYFGQDIFTQMRNFAFELAQKLDFSVEKETTVNVNSIPIFGEIMQILRARKLFAELCYYLSRIREDQLANYVGACYAKIGGEWNIVWNLLLDNYYFRKDDKELREKIANRILKAVELEEQIVKEIFSNETINVRLNNICNEIFLDQNYIFEEIILDNYFNNKAFQCKKGSELKADLTGHNEYFLEDSLPMNREISVGKTCISIGNGLDNFICDKQRIDIGKAKYRKIYIVGCSEWGNGFGKVVVKYHDHEEPLLLELPDWYYTNAGEINVVWRGKAKDWEGKIVERAMFCADFVLKKDEIVRWIEFPQCSNMHIFGVFLLK